MFNILEMTKAADELDRRVKKIESDLMKVLEMLEIIKDVVERIEENTDGR